MTRKTIRKEIECPCGRFFTSKNGEQFRVSRYCSKDCFMKFNIFPRHAWMFNREDMRGYEGVATSNFRDK